MRILPHTEPTLADLGAIGGRNSDGPDKPDKPFVTLNLNRYRDRASYPAGASDAEVSSREAYVRYGIVAVWYPSRAAFLALEHHPGYREAFELHRRAAIEHATLLFFAAGAEPKLDTPYGG